MSSYGHASVGVYVLISSFYKDTWQIGLGPTLMTSFQLNFLFKDPPSKYSHILRCWGLGLQYMNSGLGSGGGHNSAHNCYLTLLLKIFLMQ